MSGVYAQQHQAPPTGHSSPRNIPQRMEEGRKEMMERIWSLTMEFIYLMTGEEYTMVKKTSGDHVTFSSQSHVSEDWRTAMDPPPPFLIPERNNDKKILEVINKITELLTGEVPIRCQDVAVYFSMEEWEYMEGHKDIMMEDQLPLTPPDNNNNIMEVPITFPDREDDDVSSNASEKQSVSSDLHPELHCEDLSSPPSTHERFYPHILPATNQEVSTGGEPRPWSEHSECLMERTEFVLFQDSKTGENLYSCLERGKCFPYKSHLLRHESAHAEKGPYSCWVCGKCFLYRSALLLHEMIHTGEKPFSCSQCQKRFNRKSTLNRHQIMHTGDKSYCCSVCGKCFSQRPHLLKHDRVHSGERPFPCVECGKRFFQQSDLNRHERAHRGVKPYSCSQCGKGFSQKSILTRHERIHIGEKTD